ncbi:hypothetical protein DNTS_013769 [Danionella cerebrum]|uniref:Caspase-6 n=1 Tax=Danionella cerebrum TaxID=2873325 RepID=A0A553NIT6_9TELE|nr:hypothetical protein DNTS_013769 [Danionella translucida]
MASHGISNESVEKNFTEPDGLDPSLDANLEYNMNHTKRGMALIFNHESFYWKLALDFEVKAFDDYTRDDILTVITDAAASSHVDADCFVCVFLSHGENGHIFAKDAKIDIHEITDLFKGDKCQSLVGKPKIFILQACRGDKHDEPVMPMDVVDSQALNEVVVDAGVFYTLPAGADFVMCYSVAEGYYSHRETVNGSWYIQDLCEILRRFGSTLEFTEILMLVNRKVSLRSVHNCKDPSAIGKKQVPCFASMLTKKLFLRPKKE